MLKNTLIALLMVLLCARAALAQDPYASREWIKALISANEPVADEYIRSRQTLTKFYVTTDNEPVWVGPQGPLPRLKELVTELNSAYSEGLRPDNYHASVIWSALKAIEAQPTPTPKALAEIEVLATDAFLTYGADLKGGRVDPGVIYEGKYGMRRRADATEALRQVAAGGDVKQILISLEPNQSGYDLLKKGLAKYRKIALNGGWPSIPEGPALRPGMTDRRVAAMQRRLVVTGELAEVSPKPDFYGPELQAAVKAFQLSHGLEDDGVAGPATVKEMNVTARARIRQLELNMERWRWFPPIPGGRFILVNVSDFQMSVFEDFKPVLTMRVVVGMPLWDTPSLTSKVTRIVLNPSWYVPKNIVLEEVVPGMIKNPNYLKKNNLLVVTGKADTQIDPKTISWKSVSESNLNFRVMQPPGPKNPLGQIKFLFANTYEVYMHDTPSGKLFDRNVRTFSHGCIRIEKPMELRRYLLKDSPEWTEERIQKVIDGGIETGINLKNPIEVHLFYLTAWVSRRRDGTIQARLL